MQGLPSFVDILHKTYQSAGLMEFDFLCGVHPAVFEYNRKLGI